MSGDCVGLSPGRGREGSEGVRVDVGGVVKL